MGGIIPPQDFAFFCDESGISQDRYMTIGGITVRRDRIAMIHRNMDAYRERYNMRSELKWSKISNQKETEYEALVKHIFAMINENYLHFHSVIFDSHKWNHRRYNDGDADIGVSKLYYQLLLHRFCRRCGRHGSLFACLDHRNSSTSLNDLRNILNAGAAASLGIVNQPFEQVVSGDSKQDDLLQINDVILGAVCAVRNGRHLLAETRRSKRRIAELVLERSGLESFDVNSPAHVRRFTVWNFRHRER